MEKPDEKLKSRICSQEVRLCEHQSSRGPVIRWCRERFCVGGGGLDAPIVILAAKMRG